MGHDVQVIVVGAGPVGIVAALELTRLGKTVRIFSADQGVTTESRATGVLPQTLDLLDPSGAAVRLIAAGVPLRGVRVVSGGRLRAIIDPTRLNHRFNFMLSLPQSRTVAILTACLAERGVQVEYGCTVTDIVAGADYATATVERGSVVEVVAADWLIGADGAHSTVRKALGIDFPGNAYSFQWSLADVDMAGDADPARGDMILDRYKPILLRLPIGDGVHRVISNGPDVLDRIPVSWKPGTVHWQSDYKVSHRMAESLGRGRAWIVGDAAHIHSPAGGRGMNLGIEDAATLAARIVAGNLGNWERERLAKAQATIRESDAMQRMATADGALPRWLIPWLIGLMTRVPFLHDRLITRLAGPS